MIDLIPSSGQGFARNAGESRYPNLWAGYLGPVAPWLCGRTCADPGPQRLDGTLAGVSSALTISSSPLGPAIKLSGNVSIQWPGHATLGNKFQFGGPADDLAMTVQVFFRYVHKSVSHTMNLFHSDAPTVGDPYGYQLHLDANADRMTFSVFDGNPGNPLAMQWLSPTSYLSGSVWHHFVLTMYGWDANDPQIGQRVMFWLDGKMSYPSETVTRAAIAFSNSLVSKLGGRVGLDPDFEIALLSIWRRRLAWGEIDGLCADPLAMFRRPADRVSKAARIVSVGGVTLRRMNAVLAG